MRTVANGKVTLDADSIGCDVLQLLRAALNRVTDYQTANQIVEECKDNLTTSDWLSVGSNPVFYRERVIKG